MPANISRWFGRAISGPRTRFSRCRNRRSTPPKSIFRLGRITTASPVAMVRDARRCRAPHHEGTPHPEERALARVSKDDGSGAREINSQRDAAALVGGPIAGVVDLDRLKGQRAIGERLPAGGDAFHEILDFLQISARPFFLNANVLQA